MVVPEGWTERPFEAFGREFRVFSRGAGQSVVVLHELQGAGPELFEFAEKVGQRGYRVHVPVLYGEPYRDMSIPVALVRTRLCLWHELHLFATGRTSPLVRWVGRLVDDLAGDEGEPVAVIGMCMTGGIILGLLAHGAVAAGVAAQPSLPAVLPLPKWRENMSRSLGMSADDVAAAAASSTPLMVLRYADDRLSPAARLNRIIEELGSACSDDAREEGMRVRRCGRVTAVELDGPEHATLTYHSTPAAVAAAMQFLEQHLPPSPDES